MDVVINSCYGGFSLSYEAMEWIQKNKPCPHIMSKDGYNFNMVLTHEKDEERTCPSLIAVVKALGKKASGGCANLKIVTIPDDVKWTIEEYDGVEWISEVHRVWQPKEEDDDEDE